MQDINVDALRGLNAERLVVGRGGQDLVQGRTGFKGHVTAFFKGTSVAGQNEAVWAKLGNAIRQQYQEHGEDIARAIISRFDTSKPISSRQAVAILESARMRNELIGLWGQSGARHAIAQILRSDEPILLSEATDAQHMDIMKSGMGFQTAVEVLDSDAFWNRLGIPPSMLGARLETIKDEVLTALGADPRFRETQMWDSDMTARLTELVKDSATFREMAHYTRQGRNYLIDGKAYVNTKLLGGAGKSGGVVLLMKERDGDGLCVFKAGNQHAWDGQMGVKKGLGGEANFYRTMGEHPNIVEYYGCVEADIDGDGTGGGGLLLEYVPGKDLHDLQKDLSRDANKTDATLAKKYLALQALTGLRHINDKGWAMYDFGAYNCRVRNDGALKLYDFDMFMDPERRENIPDRDIQKFIAMLSTDDFFGKDPEIMAQIAGVKGEKDFEAFERKCKAFLDLSPAQVTSAKALIAKLV